MSLFSIVPNVRRYALLPLQGAFVTGYPQDKQMDQHEQPLGTAIAYDRLLCAVLFIYSLFIWNIDHSTSIDEPNSIYIFNFHSEFEIRPIDTFYDQII
jgi:hypothetical protein